MIRETRRGDTLIENLSDYKMEILHRCTESDRLTKLLAYDSKDALFKESVEDAGELIYKRVFPYRFVPDPIEKQTSYLTVGTSGFRKHQEGFKVFDDYQSGEVYFYLFTHVDLMRTDSGVRQDLMLREVSRLFDGTRGLGIGELKLRGVNELWMHNNKFGGYTASFTIIDFG